MHWVCVAFHSQIEWKIVQQQNGFHTAIFPHLCITMIWGIEFPKRFFPYLVSCCLTVMQFTRRPIIYKCIATNIDSVLQRINGSFLGNFPTFQRATFHFAILFDITYSTEYFSDFNQLMLKRHKHLIKLFLETT